MVSKKKRKQKQNKNIKCPYSSGVKIDTRMVYTEFKTTIISIKKTGYRTSTGVNHTLPLSGGPSFSRDKKTGPTQ